VELKKYQFTMVPSQVNSHLSSPSQVLTMLSQRLPPSQSPQPSLIFSEEAEDVLSKDDQSLGCLKARILPESCFNAPKRLACQSYFITSRHDPKWICFGQKSIIQTITQTT
jgi:hypothetical protein